MRARVLQVRKDPESSEVPRITVRELKRRMDAGEGFTVIDVRNPRASAETDTEIPDALRGPLDKLEESLPRIPKNRPVVAYCTDRTRRLAAAWCRNSRSGATKMLEPSWADSKRGRKQA
jgi:rhodanese-related sulfurtransferase